MENDNHGGTWLTQIHVEKMAVKTVVWLFSVNS